jgi:hypothetical protein
MIWLFLVPFSFLEVVHPRILSASTFYVSNLGMAKSF